MNRKPLLLLSCFLFIFVLAGRGRAAPQAADVLNVAWFYDVSTLDPALAYDSASIQVLANVYDTLLSADPTDPAVMQPALATAWNVSPDGLTYTFTIRRGVAFHDGALLTPTDVAYSLQRGLLQSDPGSPQWLFLDAIMGYHSGDVTEEIAGGAYVGDPPGLRANADPTELLATCNKVKSRVVADDAAGTVTLTLARANGAFPSILSEYGYALDAGWAAAQGDWNGDCATWQNFYAPNLDQGSRLNAVTNGTGGFRLESWTPGDSIRLRRHAAYWRTRPQAAVPLEQVTIAVDQDSSTFPLLLQNGDVDMASVFSSQWAALDDAVLLEYVFGGGAPALRHANGALIKVSGIPSPAAMADLFLNFNVATGGTRNYIGSGLLDGAGVPPDFFNDAHVRRAFAFAFDYDAFNDAVYSGTGIRRTGPIVKPLMGYNPGHFVYDYDPTQAAAEMAQAWGGQVAANGFRLTLAYNEGNIDRQKAAELLESGLEALNSKYQIDVVSISWPDFLSDYRNGAMPVATSGWIADYQHPHGWVEPYLVGTFAGRQNLPDALRQSYQQQVDACRPLLGNAARACYEALQAQAYADAATIYTFQQATADYARAEVHGLAAARRANGAIDYSRLWKGGAPAAAFVSPATPQELNVTGASGMELEVVFPAGALPAPRAMLVWSDTPVAQLTPAGLKAGRLSFSLTDWDAPAARAADLTFSAPVETTITYTAAQIAPLIEEGLVLMRREGGGWVDAACGDVVADPAENVLRVPICQTGEFALMGPTYDAQIPVVVR